MTAVTIERCTLTVVRHGGWSWGADAPDLARKAIAWLPLLLARYLAELRVGDEELNLRAPVRVTVPLYLSELLAAPPATADPDSPLPQALQGLAGRLQAALQPVLSAHGLGRDPQPADRPKQASALNEDSRNPEAGTVPQPRRQPLQSLWPLLAFWHERGMLPRILVETSPQSRTFWHRQIFSGHPSPVRSPLADTERKVPDVDGTSASDTPRRHDPAEAATRSERLFAALGEVLAPYGVSRDLYVSHPREASATDEQRRQLELAVIPQPLQHLWPQLVFWHERGLLPQFLAGASPQSLDFWHRLVLATSPGPHPGREAGNQRESTPSSLVGKIQSCHADAEPGPVSTLQRQAASVNAQLAGNTQALRIFLVVAAASRLGVAPTHPLLWGLLDWAHPLDIPPQNGPSERETPMGEGTLAPAPTPVDRAPARGDATPLAAARDQTARNQTARGGPVARVYSAPLAWQAEIDIPCVLPFLLLPRLSRLGYLQALDATLNTMELNHAAPLFAAALAFKAMPPPRRGWLRTPAEIRAASTFAGLREPLDQAALTEFARHWSGLGDVLDGVLAMSLINGHRAGQPLLLQKWQDRHLLLDSEGLVPIAVGSPRRLAPVLGALIGEVTLIPAESFDAELKQVLEQLGCAWITDAPPVRGERVCTLQVLGRRYYSNDEQRSEAALNALARPLAQLAELGRELAEELLAKRPALPPNADDDLERHLFLVAACALGDMAWTLWRDTEAPTPVPALTRFGDMDARVRFSADTVTVSLPMGRRYLDLYRHDLLGDVAHVPWLGGRLLQFRGG